MSSPSSAVPVVCALIERDGAVLIAQRPPHKSLPLKWEFPGGKVEPGEEPTAALAREIREELGCEITALDPLPTSVHDYGTTQVRMMPFITGLAPGSAEPRLTEHVAFRWVTPGELFSTELAGADLAVLGNYVAQL